MLIGEVAQRAGVSARMLRHYDAIGLVPPTGRTAGGYREYSPEDVRRLFHVVSLRSLGLPLEEVKRALDDADFRPGTLVAELIATTQERIARDQELLGRLRRVRDGGPAAWGDVLDVVALLRGLDSIDPGRRQQVALSTAEDDQASAVPMAEALLREDDPVVEGALQWALARSGGDALRVLERALGSPEEEVRGRAVSAIAKIGGDDAHRVLAGALDHPDAVVRGRAALVLGAGGSSAAAPELVRMVVEGVDDVEAAEVLGGLARQHGTAEELVRLVAAELHRPGAPGEARVRLVQALAELPAAATRALLTELADDPDPGVALVAVYLQREVHPPTSSG